MMPVYVGPATLVNLGTVGETDLLEAFDGPVIIPAAVAAEVTTEPARTNMEKLVADSDARVEPVETDQSARAQRIVGVDQPVVESRLLEPVLERRDREGGPEVGIVTEDRRLRTVGEGLGATVTGTFGVVVRAARGDKYLPTSQAKRIIRRIDSQGLHLTGELRAQAIGDL